MPRLSLAAALALAGCTNHTVRPLADAELLQVQAVGGDHGLALFDHALAPPEGPRFYLAKLHQDGPVAWFRPLPTSARIDRESSPRVFGNFAAIAQTGSLLDQEPGMIRASLVDGRSEPWVSPGGLTRVLAFGGDARQVFAFFVGEPPAPGAPRPLELVALDSQDPGAPQWTAPARLHAGPREFLWRADERHLLYPEPGIGWHVLRRDDGVEVATIDADPGGICPANKLWWGRRADHLLMIDLAGDALSIVAPPADFIPAQLRNQWTLTDCGAHGGDTIVWADLAGVSRTVMSALDGSGRPRWTLTGREGPARSRMNTVGAPAPLGDLALLDGECVVDLERGEVRWCLESDAFSLLSLGTEGGPLFFGQAPDDLEHGRLIRVTGSGEITSLDLRGLNPHDALLLLSLPPPGARLWLPGIDRTPHDVLDLPRVTIDTATLRPVGRLSPAIVTREAAAEDLRQRPFVPPPAALSDDLRPTNPIDAVYGPSPAPAARDAPPGVPADIHPTIFAAARAAARLPEDAPIRLLAWRSSQLAPSARIDSVLAFAEQRDEGAPPRWVVFKAMAVDNRLMPEGLAIWTFLRRPTNTEVYQLALTDLDVMVFLGLDIKIVWTSGVIDDAAWRDLTNAPRSERWLLR